MCYRHVLSIACLCCALRYYACIQILFFSIPSRVRNPILKPTTSVHHQSVYKKITTTKMSGKKVYIARHGERIDFVNASWRSTARLPDDPQLTERGERQAQDLGKKLRDLNIGNIYSSPFQRCIRTAAYAASEISDSARIRIEPGVCEWLNPSWYAHTDNGPIWRTVAELKEGAGTVNGVCRIDPSDYTSVRSMKFNNEAFPESKSEHFQRCAQVVREIIEKDEGDKNILLLGHGSSVEALFVALCPRTFIRSVTYCSLTECVPREDGTYHAPRYICENSFLTHAEKPEETRYI